MERASKLLQGWLPCPWQADPTMCHTPTVQFSSGQEEELLLVAALSYLSTHCLFMSLCCIHLLPWCQPCLGLAGDRPVFMPVSFPGLLGLTAPRRAWIHRSSHKDTKRSVSIADPWEETHLLLLAIYSHRPFLSETTDTIFKWRKTTTQPLMG